jgi:hypothetical protein
MTIRILFFLLLFTQAVRGQESRLSLSILDKKDLTIKKVDSEYHIETTGKDPFVFTNPIEKSIGKENKILAFEYFCPKGLDHFQVFFGASASEMNSKKVGDVGLSEGWVGFTIDVSREIGTWGKAGDKLRLDFGSQEDIQIQIRNIVLRPMNEREKKIFAEREEKVKKETQIEARLKNYLSTNYPSQITEVKVTDQQIIVKGNTNSLNQVYLCEVTPYQDVTEETNFEAPILLKSSVFEQKINRFVITKGFNYDRLLSKWVLTQKNGNTYKVIAHAHYPDNIQAKYDLPKEMLKGRKGIGGFSTNRKHTSDLDELNITSVTVNIGFAKFMFTQPTKGRIEHIYNGKSYYFREKDLVQFDSTFTKTAQKGIISAAILLIDKAEKCPDPEIGRLLQHPDMDPSGIYSMPNMTTPASVDCYAAALDFLAARYSRPDKKYGRLNHWIMHNEVDAGWEWTNMGEKTASIFMDTYLKSMRLCYAIARKYNPHSEVFITLTHHWALKAHPHFYPSKSLMEILLQYSKTEGDFEWAMAQHPYPQSLFEPKTWLDKQVDFTFNTPLITFKNLEVLDAWIKRPAVLYQGKTKRTLWLSENGTNSKTYSEQDLKEQAAGFAYTWKKLKKLDGIDGFQWHNWYDHRKEGGLRIGLRRFPDDEQDAGGAKPVWYVFKAADTDQENSIFDPYKNIIGIKNWDEVVYKGIIRD